MTTVATTTAAVAVEKLAQVAPAAHVLSMIDGWQTMSEPRLTAKLIEWYLADYRNPDLPRFTTYRHDRNSIFDWRQHPEVNRPAVYVHYDDEDRLFYIGSSWCPCQRHDGHFRYGVKAQYDRPARIDVIDVTYPWEINSLETFLQAEFPNYEGHYNAWKERQEVKRRATAD